MKELSLHLLDVAKNSVAAGATWVDISLDEDKDGRLTIVISDNGRGMSPEFLAQVTDPFTTTRTTRKVGLGLPLLPHGGGADRRQPGYSEHPGGKGTTVTAVFHRRHIGLPSPGGHGGHCGPAHPGQSGAGPSLPVHHRPGDGWTLDTGAAAGAFWGRISPWPSRS